jgi:hypothetical protein
MAIPNTDNTAALFVTRAPAWEKGVELEQGMAGSIDTSRSGLEQRQQRRFKCGWKLSYKAALDAANARQREERSLAEIKAPLWVPFWTEKAILANPITLVNPTTVNLDRIVTHDFFAVDDYVLLRHATLGDQFRKITAWGINTQQIIFESLGGAEVLFPIGTACYPCRLCIRSQGMAEMQRRHADSTTESLVYVTL